MRAKKQVPRICSVCGLPGADLMAIQQGSKIGIYSTAEYAFSLATWARQTEDIHSKKCLALRMRRFTKEVL